MTILKRYKCVKSNDEKLFTLGEIYPLYKGNENYIVANNNVKWYEKEFPLIEEQMGVELEEKKDMLNAKEGQTYIIKKAAKPWWTEGKEYEVVSNGWGELCLVDDNGDKWEVNYLSNRMSYKLELKEKETNEMLDVKEGQTYICKRDDIDWWTKDKEYKVQKFSDDSRLYLTDDSNYHWYLNNNLLNQVFKLKEKTFDLNKLTTAQLKEYVGLLEDKEKTESLLNDFIERMSK